MKTIFDDILREDVLEKFNELDELAGEFLSENPRVPDKRYPENRLMLSGMCILFVMIMRTFGGVDNPKYYMINLMVASEPVSPGNTPLKYTIRQVDKSESGSISEVFKSLFGAYDHEAMENYYIRFEDVMSLIMDGFWDNEDHIFLRHFFKWNIDRIDSEEERYELLGTEDLLHSRFKTDRYSGHGEKEEGNKKAPDSDSTEKQDMQHKCESFLRDFPRPSKIKEYLDKFIVGQDDAKKLISLSIYQHYNRILHEEEGISKFNVLMIGPSGCGKTEIIRRLKEIVNLPIITADFSGIVSTPYKGRNKEDELIRLYKEAGEDMYLAERGIMFLDEFDKICKPGDVKRGYSNADELMGQLLSMMEGSVIDTAQRSHVDKYDDDIMIDTKNILFVCLGAFDGLDDIILRDSKRLEGERTESGGFGMTPSKSSEKISSDDVKVGHLIKYGIKPELAGRLCNLAVLDPIDREMMIRIMTEAQDSAIKLFQKELLLDDGIELQFTQDALETIADKGLERGVGARAINSVIRESLTDIMFEAPSMKKGTVITVTGEMIKAGLG